MTTPAQQPAPKSKFMTSLRKYTIIATVMLIAIGSFTVYWRYFNTYSEGNRSGLLQKFSYKGHMFKTYEGELIMSSIKSSANVSLYSEKFQFSVVDKVLAKRLLDLEGRVVTVHYEYKRAPLFWRGETSYIVDGVKVQD